MKTRYKEILLLLIVAVFCTSAMAQNQKLRVVTSIKPLTLLVKAVAPDNVEITTLIPAGASPHTYQMRPSDRQAMAEADFIFWMGPELETFLQRLLAQPELARKTTAMMPKAARISAEVEQHDHKDEKQRERSHNEAEKGKAERNRSDDHGHATDPHVWLDPELALDIAERLKRILTDHPAADARVLKKHLSQFRQDLKATERRIREQLVALNGVTLFTYHEAFGRFADHYGLKLAGSLTPTPETSPGARHLNRLQNRLKVSQSPCLLTEPQFNRDWWRNLTEGRDIALSVWDPLAGDIAVSSQGYINFQQHLADAALGCLPE